MVCAAACLYLIGQRSDQTHAGRGVSETGANERRADPSDSRSREARIPVSLTRPAGRGVSEAEGSSVRPREDAGAPGVVTHPSASLTPRGLYRGRPATYWANQYRYRTSQLQQARRALHHRWQPTVDYALRLASAVFGVSYWELRSVSYCESHHHPWASNGRYRGLFQLGWAPFGMSPYDPVANALSAAQTVSHDGSWRQWTCRP